VEIPIFLKNPSYRINNHSTRIYSILLGVLAGGAGLAHGIFEIMRGNASAVDILERIGAFTIFPNYLLAGIVTVALSLLLFVWVIGFIQLRIGSPIYALLILMLFLSGGGIAPVVGLFISWAVASQIGSPLAWWKKILPEKVSVSFARYWLAILSFSYFLLLIGIGIWLVFTPPGEIYRINIIDYLCWLFLGVGAFGLILSIVAGFARDLERRPI
jgi:hypothetical protein